VYGDHSRQFKPFFTKESKMTGNEAKILTSEEKSLVKVHRKTTKMLDLRAFFMIWAIELPRMLK
jgi:hypothetical protein